MALPRVLVVDDDPNMLSLMRPELSYAGYVVDPAGNGEQALMEELPSPGIYVQVLDGDGAVLASNAPNTAEGAET